jgi:hypothetical protein
MCKKNHVDALLDNCVTQGPFEDRPQRKPMEETFGFSKDTAILDHEKYRCKSYQVRMKMMELSILFHAKHEPATAHSVHGEASTLVITLL